MEIALLLESNPWWTEPKVPSALKGVPRHEYSQLIRSVNIKEITIIKGVRRSGKSTLMYQMIDSLLNKGTNSKQILFVNLEDNKLANHSLDEIFDSYRSEINPKEKAFVFLDEIHRREKWETWVRKKYDLAQNCKFVVSGSSSYLLSKEYSTLLTGRNVSFDVYPLSFKEFLSFKGISFGGEMAAKGSFQKQTQYEAANALKEFLSMGGFPSVFFTEIEFKNKLLAQYFDDIIYRDIVERHNLNPNKAKNLALFLITNTGGMVSLRNIRKALGLSYKSINDYFTYYKEAFLFFEMGRFSYSFNEQKAKPSKAYCIDNGLRNAVSFKFSEDLGKLAENLVFLELKRRNKEIYYWKNKNEVDFIVKNPDNSVDAINVSFTDEISERETEGLLEFKMQSKKAGRLTVITKGLEKNQGGIRFVPLWKWLLEGK